MANQSNATAPTETAAPLAALCLPSDCRLATHGALKEQLLQASQTPAALLDGSAVERIDTAALQLLVMFRRELDSHGASLGWRGVSKVLNDAASLLGVARILELPAAEPA